jgi:hypothetical protein
LEGVCEAIRIDSDCCVGDKFTYSLYKYGEKKIISALPKRAHRAVPVDKVQSFYDVHRVPPCFDSLRSLSTGHQNWAILKRFGYFFVRLSRGRSHSNFNDLFPSSVNSAVPSFSHL